jgi:hypothetical protein
MEIKEFTDSDVVRTIDRISSSIEKVYGESKFDPIRKLEPSIKERIIENMPLFRLCSKDNSYAIGALK